MTYRGQFRNGVVVFDRPPELPDGAAVEVAAVENDIAEHDVVRVLKNVQVEGQTLRAGMTGAVVSIYDKGKAYAVEILELAGGPDVVTLMREEIEKA